MKKFFVELMSRLSHSAIHQIMWYFWVSMVFFFWKFFFSRKRWFLWSPCVLLIAESVSLDNCGKPTVGLLLKVTSPSWIILSILLDGPNSIDWLLKSWWEICLKQLLFYCYKRILIEQKTLAVSWRIFLNIKILILLWMLTSLVIWNLNITVSTIRKYCYK